MRDNIYLSSIVFNEKGLDEIVRICERSNYNLEFSSNLKHDKKNIELFNRFTRKKLIHNYFPAPKSPFVLNLASRNKLILKKSIDHCKKNILLSSKFNLPFYAAHAGFCIDPDINSLGKKILIKDKINRKINLEIFIESLHEILDFADNEGVDFYFENNVLSNENYKSNNQQNIFLCTDFHDISIIFSELKSKNLGILLDTGHLKVSAKTLNLDLKSQTTNILKYTKAIHHSENNAINDQNLPFDKNYWFIPYLKKLESIHHVIEVKNINFKIITKQIDILQNEF